MQRYHAISKRAFQSRGSSNEKKFLFRIDRASGYHSADPHDILLEERVENEV